MNSEIIQIIQALLQCIEKYPEGSENKEWFTKLFQDSLSGRINTETDLDLVYNATIGENILASILAIDIKTIVKIRMVHKVIAILWEENKWDTNSLNKYILEEKPTPLRNSQDNLREHISNETPTNEAAPTIQQNHPIEYLEEAPSEEVEMLENEYPITSDQNENMETQPTPTYSVMDDTSQDILGGNITNVQYYDIRNRKSDPINPFYITNNKRFRLGTLAVSTPGDNKKEQLTFVANALKLPTDSNLVQFEFWEGNNWITIGFDYEEDLNLCKNKVNGKEKDIIKFIQLTTQKESPNIQHTCNIEKIQPTKQQQNTLEKENNNTSKTLLSQKPMKIVQERNTDNPYNISKTITKYQGGFLAANLPGNNRKDQLDYTANILRIPLINDLITPIFHEGNIWIVAYFLSQKELNGCIDKINSQNNNKANMIALNNTKLKENKTKETLKRNTYNITKHLNPIQTYRITDIPKEYSSDRIRGALKPFGKIIKLETIQTKTNTREKTVQVTIEPSTYSKDITNRWAIPLGSIMARIVPADLEVEALKDRNQYTARLYGIPKATNTVILMRSIKNLRPKTCYVPKCSRTGKERNFAIISFQTKEELNRACTSSAKYNNHKLTWSKSRAHHLDILNNKEERFSWKNNKYCQKSIWEESSTISSENEQSKKHKTKERNEDSREYNNKCSDDTSSISMSSPSMSPGQSTSTRETFKNRRDQYKEKEKMEEDIQETSDQSETYPEETKLTSHMPSPSHSPKPLTKGKGKAKMSISTITSKQDLPKTGQFYQGKRYKNRKLSVNQEENTTAKLISLITKMADRLDKIEGKLGDLPNRS